MASAASWPARCHIFRGRGSQPTREECAVAAAGEGLVQGGDQFLLGHGVGRTRVAGIRGAACRTVGRGRHRRGSGGRGDAQQQDSRDRGSRQTSPVATHHGSRARQAVEVSGGPQTARWWVKRCRFHTTKRLVFRALLEIQGGGCAAPLDFENTAAPSCCEQSEGRPAASLTIRSTPTLTFFI